MVKFKINETLKDNEIYLECKEITPDILKIQKELEFKLNQVNTLILYDNLQEYYIDLSEILFFEVSDNLVYGHTREMMLRCKYKLYELENMLPHQFMRISKATIINLNEVYMITKNITSASKIEFRNTKKITYVSRQYYKLLQDKILEVKRTI